MSGVPTSSHGGSFTGGTITSPLVIAPASNSGGNSLLQIVYPADMPTNDWAIEVVNAAGTVRRLTLDVRGTLDLLAGSAEIDNTGFATFPNDVSTANVLATAKVSGVGASLAALTSGALPTVAPSSGVAFQCSTTRDVVCCIPFTGDGTNNAATLLIQLSPDNVTFSTLDTLSIAAALNLTGALNVPVTIGVPAAWRVKLTASHGTIGTATYY